MASAQSEAAASTQQGRRLFLQLCASCHGENGNGKPASGLTLKPPALDLTAYELSPPFIRRVLEEGVPGTGMASWKSLPAGQLSALTTYTALLGHRDGLSPATRAAPAAVLQEAGRRVYAAHCVRCHGDRGQGDGPEAGRYQPPPADFTSMRPTFSASARVIEDGIPGTAMPSWPLLTSAEVQAVSFYLRSLYRGAKQPPARAGGWRAFGPDFSPARAPAPQEILRP